MADLSRDSGKTARTVVSVDPHGKALSQKNIHTRWHPDIPAVAQVEQGEVFKVECMDFTGNAIGNNDSVDDVLDFMWEADHHLSGPVSIKGANPGDVLRVDILDIAPFETRPWGFSLVDPGLGPLDRADSRFAKSIWDLNGIEASSRHVKDIAFAGRPHCGVIGTAPSPELLAEWTKREHGINEKYKNHGVTCALMPLEKGAYVGQELPSEVEERIKRHGARTKPAREHGGNIDSASLTRGSTIFLPVFVPGANLSIGDLHFSQGDGEPTCALEIAGIATLRTTVLPGGVAKLGLKSPMVIPSPAEPLYRDQLVFHGLSVDREGTQQRSDLTTSFVQAASHAMEYLQKFGYSHEQAYMIMAVAPVEARVLAVPNIPNANVSVGLPTKIFSFDILPSAQGPQEADRGSAAYLSPEREAKVMADREKKPSPFDRG